MMSEIKYTIFMQIKDEETKRVKEIAYVITEAELGFYQNPNRIDVLMKNKILGAADDMVKSVGKGEI